MKHSLTIRIPIAMLAALVFVSPTFAQRGFGARPAPVGRAASGTSLAREGRGAFRPAPPLRPYFRGRGRGPRWGWGWGWGWDWGWEPEWGYPPYPDENGYADYQPPVVIAPQPERVIQPILLERRGDQWVTVTSNSPSPPSPQPEAAKPAEAAEHPRELPPAVLVFRDGHEEEVRRYAIIGNTLYAKANYWTSGSWTREIEIASLDVPATMKRNQERGSNFRLPSGPQEVMIRP